jgi:hypothetical protein
MKDSQSAYCIASTSENCSACFRSYCRKVFRVFFFFFVAGFVEAHRTACKATRGISGRSDVSDDTPSLLNGAMSVRGYAMGALFNRRRSRSFGKF